MLLNISGTVANARLDAELQALAGIRWFNIAR